MAQQMMDSKIKQGCQFLKGIEMVFRSLNLETNAFNCSAPISIRHTDVCMNTREITAFIV